MLTCADYWIEDFIHVRHVEVAAEKEIAGTPVVAAHEGMNIRDAWASCGGVAEMSHIDFAAKGEWFGWKTLSRAVGDCLSDVGEDAADGVAALSPFAEDVFCAGGGVKLDAAYACAFLSTVVLLLHYEVELVETVEFRTILFPVISQGLQKADHSDSAFMLYQFHCIACETKVQN